MSKRLTFYGCSDDLFEMEGDLSHEICNPRPDSIFGYRLISKSGSIDVLTIYSPNGSGCWAIMVVKPDEDAKNNEHDWDIFVQDHDNGYSKELSLSAPDDVVVEYINAD